MKNKIVLSAVIVLCLAGAAFAQKAAKRPMLPANLASYENQYPDKLLKTPAVKARLKTLLGKNFADFDQMISVQTPITRTGDLLMGRGCLPSACTISEAAFVIDLKNKRIFAGLYEKDKEPRFFGEDGADTPQILLDWADELKQM